MSVVKPQSNMDGIRIKVRDCTDCDYNIKGTDKCTKKGHIRPDCIDGVKVIK